MAVDDLVVFSASLWAVKQAAWQPCLPRQVNKKKQPWGQQPASIITLKAARKTDTYWKSTCKKKRLITCSYLLPLQKKLIWRQKLFENKEYVPSSSIFIPMFVLLYCELHEFSAPSSPPFPTRDSATSSSVKPRCVLERGTHRHTWTPKDHFQRHVVRMNKSCCIKLSRERFLSWGPTFTFCCSTQTRVSSCHPNEPRVAAMEQIGAKLSPRWGDTDHYTACSLLFQPL